MTTSPTEVLRSLWLELQSDSAALERLRAREALRKQITPPLVAFIDSFLSDAIGVEQFKRDFDVKTRKEWDGFGLKGNSAAMLLNKFVIHLGPIRKELEQQLRRALTQPSSFDQGIAQMRDFLVWLNGLIESGVTTRADLQPRRAVLLISALWYVRDAATWPAYYESMRTRLEELELFVRSDDVVDSYARYVAVVRDETQKLGLQPWEFEFLCDYSGIEVEQLLELVAPERNRTWLWAAGRNADQWPTFKKEGIAGLGFGNDRNLSDFKSLDELRDWLTDKRSDGKRPVNDALAAWQVAHEVRVGDTVYVKKGRSQIVGRGIVTGAYRFERDRKPFPHVCGVRWEWDGTADAGEFLVMKTLTNITDYTDLVARIGRVTRSEPSGSSAEVDTEADEEDADEGLAYTIEDAEKELFWPRAEIEKWIASLSRRKNLILQGPPGVGKTFVAARLADLLIGRAARGHKVLVQFHPSYGYEDFVQGYRPTQAGFERVNGPFLEICNRALQDPKDNYVVIIDEINRAHLGKVLGELMMLIEHDKREPRWGTALAYARPDEAAFHVPPNLHIIGTMNTADRSLALVDYALRRRFCFVDLKPALESLAFDSFLTKQGVPGPLRKRIAGLVGAVNKMLTDDPSLGDGYLIGHSFFCAPPKNDVGEDWFQDIVEQDLVPLLREYWFDRRDQFEKARRVLVGEE